MVAVSASQTIRAAVPSSSSHFPLCNPQTRKPPADALREREHERRPRCATEHSVLLKTDKIERGCGVLDAAVVGSSGEGSSLRRSPARADSGRRTSASSGSIVIIVVVVGPKATRLRVDRHFAGLPIHGTGHFDIFAVAGDDDV